MPQVKPIHAITFAQAAAAGADLSAQIAPPYDVLDEGPKQALLDKSATNIVKIDLPQTPPKTVAPEPVYAEAGDVYRQWLATGVLKRADKPAVFVYQQSYTHEGRTLARRGLIANIVVQPFGPSPAGGGVFAHEKTIASGKEDRLRLMRATRAQLSPIFGIYSDSEHRVGPLIEAAIASGAPSFIGQTDFDNVRHEVWRIDNPDQVAQFTAAVSGYDIFIADGHHRYNTAINYQKENPAADQCMFVLVSMQDPGMIVLPTHRVVCGLGDATIEQITTAIKAHGKLRLAPAPTDDPHRLARTLPTLGEHAMAVYDPAAKKYQVVTTTTADPLADMLPQRPAVWRQLDVAVLHELLIDRVLSPALGVELTYKYTAQLDEMRQLADAEPGRLGVIVQPTPIQSVRGVSEANELMPAKSTYFFPKLATGLVINPLE